MGRPIDYLKREEGIRTLEHAAQKLLEKGVNITRTALANESGYSRQALSSGYLKETADKLIELHRCPTSTTVEWTYDELKTKYSRLVDQYEKLEQHHRKNIETLKLEKKKVKDLETKIEQLRGKVYLQDIKHSI